MLREEEEVTCRAREQEGRRAGDEGGGAEEVDGGADQRRPAWRSEMTAMQCWCKTARSVGPAV